MIVEVVINETINTIQLQLINGYFYPTNSISRDIMIDNYRLERIPQDRFDLLAPRFVRDGYKLAVNDYEPSPRKGYSKPYSPKIGGEPKSFKEPCTTCRLKDVCDSDDCGRKNFRLFSKNKP